MPKLSKSDSKSRASKSSKRAADNQEGVSTQTLKSSDCGIRANRTNSSESITMTSGTSLRQRQPLEMVPVRDPYAVGLLIEDVVPTFANWTRSSFKNVMVNGVSISWLQVFNDTIQKQFPILGPYFLERHYHNLPMILLHSMYALVLDTTQTADDIFPPGDAHYVYCKNLYRGTVTNPLEVVALIFMAFHAVSFTPSVVGGVSYFSVAVSHAAELGIFQNKNLVWEMNGTKYGKDSDSGIKLRQMITVQLYTGDFFAAHFRRISFALEERDISPKLKEFVNDGHFYNEFYNTRIWIDELKLFYIARRVSCVEDGQNLDVLQDELDDWGSRLIQKYLDSRTWTYGKMHSIFLKLDSNYLKMFLAEPELIELLLLNDENNETLEKCYNVAKQSAELASLIVDTSNLRSCFSIPIGTYTSIFTAGRYLAFLQCIPNFQAKTEQYYQMCRQSLMVYAQHFPFSAYRLAAMEKVKADPFQAVLDHAPK